MKMTPLMRKAYKVYQAFEEELTFNESASEVFSMKEKMLKKMVELYVRHRDSNDIKDTELIKSEVNDIWNHCALDLLSKKPASGCAMKQDEFIKELIRRGER